MRCPYREHAPEALEEQQAWEVVQAVSNQIAAGSRVFDLGLALELARARRFDLEVMSELLPAAQAGMLEALINCPD